MSGTKTQAEKQKVLIVMHSFERGGTEIFLQNLITSCDPEKVEISVFSLSPEGGVREEIEQFCSSIDTGKKRNKNNKIVTFFDSVSKLRNYIKKNEFDIMHCFLTGPYLVTHVACAMLESTPPIVMSRRSRNHYQKKYPGLRWFEKWCHKRTKILIGNSQKVVEDLIDEAGENHHVRLIYNGLPMEGNNWPARSVAREILGLSFNHTVILCVANLIAYKGHKDLISALAQVKAQVTRPVICLCVGKASGGYENELRQYAAQMEVSHMIRFEGQKEDIRLYEAASDFAVLASHEEGFSNAILESMRAGLAVVATDVGGNAEAITNEQTGLITPSHNSKALSKAIIALINNEKIAKEYGLRAQKFCQERYNIINCARQHEALWQEVIEQDKSGKK